MTLPPCWPEGQSCPNACAHQLLERTVYNKTPLHGHWAGWRMAGRCLVSPDGDRISPERLRGILFAEAAWKRLVGYKPAAPLGTIVRLPERERFEGCA